MKDFLVIFVASCIVTFCLLATANQINKSNDTLLEIGTCVEEMAFIEHFDGTSKEKWDTFAEYCKSEIRKEK